MPVAAAGASRWFSTTARLNSPGHPQPSANATSAPMTKSAVASVVISRNPAEPSTSSTATVP